MKPLLAGLSRFRILDKFGPLLILGFAFLFLRRFAYLDPDFFHDGFMLANAIAVHDGLVIHRDVFQFYGPFVTWVQGVLVWGESPTIHSLRTINLILAASTAMLLATTSWFGIDRKAAYTSAISWVLIADVGWSDEDSQMLPMPPLLAVFLVTASLNLGLWLIKFAQPVSRKRVSARVTANWITFMIGVPLGLALNTRLNVAFPALLSTLFVMTYLRFVLKCSFRIRFLILGFALPIILIALYLIGASAFQDWWAQVVLFPSRYHTSLVYGAWIQPFIEGERSAIPIAAILIFLLILIALQIKNPIGASRNRAPWATPGYIASVIGVGTFVLMILYVHQSVTNPLSSKGASHGMRLLMWIGLALIIINIMSVMIKSALTLVSRKLSIQEIKRAYVALLGGSCLLLLIPWLGPRYVWWAMPLGLLSLTITLFSVQQQPKRVTYIFVSMTAAAILTLGYIASIDITAKERMLGPVNTVFAGMLMNQKDYNQVLAIQRSQLKPIGVERSGVYDCQEGIFAAITGKYGSTSKYFLNEGVYFSEAPKITEILRDSISQSPAFIFTCDIERTLERSNALDKAIENEEYITEVISDELILLVRRGLK